MIKKLLALVVFSLIAVITVNADNLATLVFNPNPPLACVKCEKKVKDNLRFVKGVKAIETNLQTNTVTLTYNPSKFKQEDLEKALQKIGYSLSAPQDPCCAPAPCNEPCNEPCTEPCAEPAPAPCPAPCM